MPYGCVEILTSASDKGERLFPAPGGIKNTVITEQGNQSAPEPVWTFWRKDKYIVPAWN
jgi:hypothetical protein